MIITLLIPTRKRPEIMERIWKSALFTATSPFSIQISFFIDDDDEASISKLYEMIREDMNTRRDIPRVLGVISKRLLIGSDMWNCAYKAKNVLGDIVFYGCDNAVFKTRGWDSMVRNIFNNIPDKISYVHGTDGVRKDDLGTMGFLHKNWIKTVGFVTPPYFIFYKADRWLSDTAKSIGRKVHLENMIIEHTHYMEGKANDDTVLERRDMFKGGVEHSLAKYDLLDNRIVEGRNYPPASVALINFIMEFSK